jgi:hypothetical protein
MYLLYIFLWDFTSMGFSVRTRAEKKRIVVYIHQMFFFLWKNNNTFIMNIKRKGSM